MRILHVAKTQQVAGAENYLFDLLPLLSREGFDIHFLNLYDQRWGEVSEKYRHRLNELRARGVVVYEDRIRHKLDFQAIRVIGEVVRDVSPDLVHTHMPFADLMASVAAWKSDVPKIISSRHYDYTFEWGETIRFALYYAVANRFQDAIIAVSDRVAELSKRWEGWGSGSIYVVPHGCQDQQVCRSKARKMIEDELSLPDESILVGTVARLIHWKGHRYAIEAMRLIRKERNDVFWVFAGDGPDRQELEKHAKEVGISDRLIFLGFRTDIPVLLGAIDLLVHPTTGEAFGIALIEAMAQSTPIIATNTGAIPEIVDSERTGLIVPPRNPHALAGAVQTLASDAECRRDFGRAARERYERDFTLDKMVTNTIEAYESL